MIDFQAEQKVMDMMNFLELHYSFVKPYTDIYIAEQKL